MNSSREIISGVLNSIKSEPEVYEQSAHLVTPSASTSKIIPIILSISNAVKNSISILKISVFVKFIANLLTKFPFELLQLVKRSLHLPSAVCKKLADGMESLNADLEQRISEQNEDIAFYLEIKEYLQKRSTLSRTEFVVDILKYVIHAITLADKRYLLFLELEGILEGMSNVIYRSFSTHENLLVTIKDSNKYLKLYIAGYIALKKNLVEIKVLLDTILSEKSRLGYSASNIGDTGFIDIQNTGTL